MAAFLIIDDIAAYFRGDDSFLGEMIETLHGAFIELGEWFGKVFDWVGKELDALGKKVSDFFTWMLDPLVKLASVFGKELNIKVDALLGNKPRTPRLAVSNPVNNRSNSIMLDVSTQVSVGPGQDAAAIADQTSHSTVDSVSKLLRDANRATSPTFE